MAYIGECIPFFGTNTSVMTTLYLGLVSCEELHLSGFLQDTLPVLMCRCINNLGKWDEMEFV